MTKYSSEEFIIGVASVLFRVVFDLIAKATEKGETIDLKTVLAEAASRETKRRSDVAATEEAVDIILDGTSSSDSE